MRHSTMPSTVLMRIAPRVPCQGDSHAVQVELPAVLKEECLVELVPEICKPVQDIHGDTASFFSVLGRIQKAQESLRRSRQRRLP